MKAVVTWVAVLVGCSGPGSDGTDAPIDLTPEQGISAWVRAPDGARVPGARVLVSNDRADPDSAGLTYFLGLLPGASLTSLDLDGTIRTSTTPDVEVDVLSGTVLEAWPAQATTIDEAAEEHTITGDGFTIVVPAATVRVGDEPLQGPYEVEHARLDADSAPASPGRLLYVRNDDDVAAIELVDVLWVRGTDAAGTGVLLETDALLTLELPLDSPVDDDPSWGLYSFSTNRGLWSRGATVEVTGGVLTAEVPLLGWWAVGRETVGSQGCVQGSLVDPQGVALSGPEVRLHEAGRPTVDRRTAVDGTFCMPVAPGASFTLDVFGIAVDRSRMLTLDYAGVADDAVGECGSPACTDLGALTLDVWRDGDGDRYFTGPGGDCDDDDAGVSPNPAQGDGSWCGEGS